MLVVNQKEVGELLVWLKHTGQGEARTSGFSQVVEERLLLFNPDRTTVTGPGSFVPLVLLSRQTSDRARYERYLCLREHLESLKGRKCSLFSLIVLLLTPTSLSLMPSVWQFPVTKVSYLSESGQRMFLFFC
jgi:hypothetical protein